jgi:glyoxylase-like metal-dependent hydrolase (beta-lactamase superfamily II)
MPAALAGENAGMGVRAVHRSHVGKMRLTVIDDARFTFPSAAFAANQPEGTIVPFLERFGLPSDFVSLHMQVALVESGSRKVLLDTGMGDVTFPGNEPDNGRLASGLASIGVSREEITDVVLSHGHPDHIGSCSRDGAPMFKNAVYHMPPDELEFWTQKPGEEANFPNFMLGVGNAQLEPVRGLIQPYKAGDEVVPGITAIAARGHTIGHHAFMLKDGDGRLLHLMDAAVHYLVGPEEPDWALAVEMDQAAAADTRRRLFRMAAEEKLMVAGYHFPFPGIGRIVEQGAAWRYVPVQTA